MLFLAVLLVAALGQALAQGYPTKPVKVIVPFAPGGGADIVARLVCQHLAQRLGQPFVVDNRGGAGGIIGADLVAKAPADGYTLLLGQSGPNVLNPNLYAKLPYDAIKDFAPITQATLYPYVIAVHPSVPAQSLKERKLPRLVDIRRVDFSGRILHPGRPNEEVEVQRAADRCDPEGR